MRYVERALAGAILRAARHFPALLLTGPRRSGKTTLLRRLFPKASYALLEDPDTLARVRTDPRAFLADLRPPAILDEIQAAPEILDYLRTRIDGSPQRKGQWLLTGSQESALMRGVTESMAGRAAVLQLLPLSLRESRKVTLLRGGFPEVVAAPAGAGLWFGSYVQTYLERDVRAVSVVKDLPTFRRFLSLLASRCGTLLNRTDLAAPLGVSVPTVTHWLGILEITAQILLIPPFYESFGKRLVKSPKLYFADPGLAAHLLGIETRAAMVRSPFRDPLFEGFVASEIAKAQINAGKRREIYYFRDQQGLEVDFVVPQGGRNLLLIEAKASETVHPGMAEPLVRLAKAVRASSVRSLLVHGGKVPDTAGSALRPGVQAVSIYADPTGRGVPRWP